MSVEPESSIVVAGAGVVGMSCALCLQQAGFAVTVVDRTAPGSGCSSGNAGVISVGSVLPMASAATVRRIPAMLLGADRPLRIRPGYLPQFSPWLAAFLRCSRRRHYRRSAHGLAALQRHALAAHLQLAGLTGAGDLIRRTGYLAVYPDAASFEREAADRTLQRELGVVLEEWGAATIR